MLSEGERSEAEFMQPTEDPPLLRQITIKGKIDRISVIGLAAYGTGSGSGDYTGSGYFSGSGDYTGSGYFSGSGDYLLQG